MWAQLCGHHTCYLDANQLRDLKNLHILFADAAAINTAAAPTLGDTQTSEYGVITPQAGTAILPN